MGSQFVMEHVKHLINSCCGYHLYLKWLLSTTVEMMEWCSNDTYEMDDTTLLANLIEQLEWKKTIFMGLDKQIFAGISSDDLEAEILESEEMQSEFSSTMAWVKCLCSNFKCQPTLLTHHHPHRCHTPIDLPPRHLHKLIFCWHLLSHQFMRNILTMI